MLVAGAVLTAASVAVVVAGAGGQVRSSADSAATVAWWVVWTAPLAALAVARLSPPRLPPVDPLRGTARAQVAREAWWCLACGSAYAVALVALSALAGDVGTLAYGAIKVVLLISVPYAVLEAGGRWPAPPGRWSWTWPWLPVGVWFALAWFRPPASDGSRLPSDAVVAVAVLLGLFVINAGVEEVFYRVWLQTRLERLLGRWPAIVATSLLWGAWHLAIKSTGRPVHDVAATVVYFVPIGLFLGYLWSRYRNLWMLLLVHGAINAPLGLLLAVGG